MQNEPSLLRFVALFQKRFSRAGIAGTVGGRRDGHNRTDSPFPSALKIAKSHKMENYFLRTAILFFTPLSILI
jgi:hypothetical protein